LLVFLEGCLQLGISSDALCFFQAAINILEIPAAVVELSGIEAVVAVVNDAYGCTPVCQGVADVV
jgi:hypothetical protein